MMSKFFKYFEKKKKPVKDNCRIFISAGEPSGDYHSSNLVKEILRKRPDIEIHGIGGALMSKAGVNLVFDCQKLSVMGITDVIARGWDIKDAFSTALSSMSELNPDLVILVDYPGFNLRLAKKAKELSIPVFYYISPKIWAWGSGRIEKIRRFVDHMGLIFPFEESFYRTHGIKATFVGNPLIDSIPAPAKNKDSLLKDKIIIGLLPGSRIGEISRHLPVMLKAASMMFRKKPELRFVLSIKDENYAYSELKAYGVENIVDVEIGDVRAIFEKSDIIVAASGTVTLEAAVAGVPTVIIYKMSDLSFTIAKKLVRVDYAGLANLIAGREISPELLQDEASPEKIADCVTDLLESPEKMERMRAGFRVVRKKLGKPGAASRAADIVLSMIDRK